MTQFMKKLSFLIAVISTIAFMANAQSHNEPTKTSDSFKPDSGVVSPVFPGGNQGWSHFLSYYIRYPKNAYIQRIQGTVVVQVFIEADGTLTNPVVLSSPSADLSNESLRVISLSPKWKPATKDGKPIKVKCGVPVIFALVTPPPVNGHP